MNFTVGFRFSHNRIIWTITSVELDANDEVVSFDAIAFTSYYMTEKFYVQQSLVA